MTDLAELEVGARVSFKHHGRPYGGVVIYCYLHKRYGLHYVVATDTWLDRETLEARGIKLTRSDQPVDHYITSKCWINSNTTWVSAARAERSHLDEAQ